MSSTEAEYVASSNDVIESDFVRRIVKVLEPHHGRCIIGHEDNQEAMRLATTPLRSVPSHHIDIPCHYLRHRVIVHYFGTNAQRTEILTQPVKGSQSLQHISRLVVQFDKLK